MDQQAWRCLAGAVEESGSAGLRGLLGWQLYKVPNISGAQGKRAARRNLTTGYHLTARLCFGVDTDVRCV